MQTSPYDDVPTRLSNHTFADNLGQSSTGTYVLKRRERMFKTPTPSRNSNYSNSSNSSSEQKEFGHIDEVHSSDSANSSSEQGTISKELREALDSERPNCLKCGEELSYSDVQCEASTHSFCL